MAEGIRARARTNIGVGITGIAGPGGGTPQKPVGTVWLALAHAPATLVSVERLQLRGDRSAIRRQTVERALQRLLQVLQGAKA
jgi:PncC family amidohydrolase